MILLLDFAKGPVWGEWKKISSISLFLARLHTCSHLVWHLQEDKDCPLHSPKSVSILANKHFHAWVSVSGTSIYIL